MLILYIFVFVLGLLIGYLIGHYADRDNHTSISQGQRRSERIALLKEHIMGKREITNEDVERLLGVSDATAERYLQELEVQGLLEQVNKSGPYVKYLVKKR